MDMMYDTYLFTAIILPPKTFLCNKRKYYEYLNEFKYCVGQL